MEPIIKCIKGLLLLLVITNVGYSGLEAASTKIDEVIKTSYERYESSNTLEIRGRIINVSAMPDLPADFSFSRIGGHFVLKYAGLNQLQIAGANGKLSKFEVNNSNTGPHPLNLREALTLTATTYGWTAATLSFILVEKDGLRDFLVNKVQWKSLSLIKVSDSDCYLLKGISRDELKEQVRLWLSLESGMPTQIELQKQNTGEFDRISFSCFKLLVGHE